MAGPAIYSGLGAPLLKLSHPLNSEDGDQVGPGAYTLKGGATIEANLARFDKGLLCDASNEFMDSDVKVASLDVSDGARLAFHLFWQTDSLSFNRTFFTLTESTFVGEKVRIFFDIGFGRITLRWRRDVDLTAGKPIVDVNSNTGLFSINTPFEIFGFIDSGSISRGKIFVDGVDETASVLNVTGAIAGAGTHDFLRLGNFINGLDPARSVDHFAMIQDPAMDDSKAAALAVQYTG